MGWALRKNYNLRGANEQAHVDPPLAQRMHVVWASASLK